MFFKRMLSDVIICSLVTYCIAGTRVTVEQGELEGTIEQLSNGSSYYSFKGIPYAQPPLGKLRFLAPKPPLKWNGTRDAKKHGNICIQYDDRISPNIEGDEDCLYLNVFTKHLNPEKLKPVLFWIHGGSYVVGSGDTNFYDPDFLLNSDDIVIVTFNYRLEALGFLSFQTKEAPGNAGLKDQVAALKWVRGNIHNFGGDKNNVTLAGCSAGSTSVTMHLLSNQSLGLFNQAIALSGTTLNTWSVVPQPRQMALKASELLGNLTEDVNVAVNFLRSVPARSFVQLIKTTVNSNGELMFGFGPVIEHNATDTEPFLTKSPEEYLKDEASFSKVPLVIGSTSAEGIEFAKSIDTATLASVPGVFFVPGNLLSKCKSKEQKRNFGQRVKDFYFNSYYNTKETKQNLVNALTDAYFLSDIKRFADVYSKHAPVYFYQFDFEGERGYYKSKYKISDVKGVCHAEDIFYAFNATFSPFFFKPQGKNLEFITNYVKLWTNFITKGNPTPDGEVIWKPYTKAVKNYLHIAETFTSEVDLEKERMDFWQCLHEEVD